MVSGSSSAEALIPGSPAVIAGALENVGAGIGVVRSIGEAWPMLQVPSWMGQGATGWASFVPREGARFADAPAAFSKVASALARYQGAFLQARAEVQAAIEQARVAEQATAQAVSDHRTAVRKAALADPGTPGAVSPVYRDPGAAGLADAQSRVATARLQLNVVGTEVASVIYSAAASVSGARPEITDDGWDAFWDSPFGGNPLFKLFPEVDAAVGDFMKGFVSAAWDTVIGLNDLIETVNPAQRLMRDLRTLIFEGPDGVSRKYVQEYETLVAVGSDPWGTLREMWRAVSAEDLWAEHPAEATGRVTFEIASLLIPVTKFAKAAQAAKAARGAGEALGAGGAASAVVKGGKLTASQQALVDQLLGQGVKVSPEKIVAIMKTPEGKTVWLEKGKNSFDPGKPSGLAHIVEGHGGEFAQRGISEAQIPEVVSEAITQGRIIGHQGNAIPPRPIYEFEYNGKTLKLAITIGDNGFIVGANFSS